MVNENRGELYIYINLGVVYLNKIMILKNHNECVIMILILISFFENDYDIFSF